ncbi:P-loop containing nucleoside triphosphate hydrolase protein [Hyaloraphidium curvatum]|nr:P-loop containing nucleoside triphosphate hydrolase protein [Hyaloraphidium curvatum]
MVVGLASDNSAGLGSLQQLFASHVQVPSPDALRRAVILEGLLRTSECATADLPTSDVANRLSKLTPGYLSSDLEAVLAHAAWNAALRSLNGSPTGATAPQLVWDDFKFALSIAKASQSVTVEQSRPSTSWDSIGGYNHIIQRLRLMVETSLLSPDSFNELGVKPPSGVLLLGEPGCGKTVLANALGSNPALNFLSISASEVFSKYLGESERYIRDLFAKAKRLKPCLLLFDEIDAIGTQRGAESEASNGVPERILSTMLNEMDGVETMGTGLFILGCTNRLDMVDQALLRPGRFDRVVKIPPPDRQDRVAILEALRRRTPFPEELVNDLAMRTDGFVAGDIAGIVNDAANAALRQSTGAAAISRHSFDTAFEHFARKRAGRSA